MEITPTNHEKQSMIDAKSRTLIKVFGASTAFIPLPLLALTISEKYSNSLPAKAAVVFHLPAASLSLLAGAYWGPNVATIVLIVLIPLWDLCVAIFLYKCIDTFFEKHPNGFEDVDWTGFWVRGFCGGFLGCLIGWRVWIGYGARATLLNLLGTMAVFAVILGLAMGAFYQEDFWKRKI